MAIFKQATFTIMNLNPMAHPESVNGLLAIYLSAQKETIIAEWIERVRGDLTITATDVLNSRALKNHLPELFDDLIETLRRYGSTIVASQTVKDAEDHGAVRSRQGYRLSEMLRELKHLRAVLIYHLRLFEEQNPDRGMAERLFVSTTLHGFVDEMAIHATEEYLST
ncbi:MAG: RsbRD N-terminal domain-containing protein [Prosthecobacter sp.]